MDKATTKRGRPPLPAAQRATSQIQLRVTQRRKAAYFRAAGGQTLSSWALGLMDRASGYAE